MSIIQRKPPANEYVTEEGGLSVKQVVEAVEFIKENLAISSATIAAYNPKCDPQSKTLEVGFNLIRKILQQPKNELG